MGKAVRMSIFLIGAITALFVGALIYFASTFDINDYKDRITKAVLDETGRTLTFKDQLSLDFFPGVGVKLGGVSLSNAKGFGNEPMVEVGSADISVRILPLLKGDIKFGGLNLENLRLHLSRNKNGVANWDDLVGRKGNEEAPLSDDKSFSLEIGGVSIKDATLFWDDEVTDIHFIVSKTNLETGQIYQGAPFPLTASLDFKCAKPNINGSITLSGKTSVDFENREYGHMDMKVSVTAEGKDVPGGRADGDLKVQFAALDFNKKHAQITGLVASAYGATIYMDGSLDGITNGFNKIAATLTVDPMDAKKTLASLGLDTPETADDSALTKVGGTAEVLYSPGNIHLKSTQIDLDGSRIIGSARYTKAAGTTSYFARLDIGELDLDRYLPPDHEEKKQETKDAVAKGDKDDRIFDTRGLRDLNVDMEANIAKLRVESMWFEQVKAAIKAKDGIIRLSPLSANMYGGTLSAGLTVNAQAKYPKTDLIAGLNKVDIGRLSKDVSGTEDYQGILDFNGAASCQGERVQTMLRSMNGKLSVNLADGVFPGVNLTNMAKKTHESKEKKGEIVADKTASTKFGSIHGTGIIQAGILKNNDLEIKAPGLRADGKGAIVLPTRQIEYLLKAKLVATSKGQGGESSDDLIGVMVPIRVGGTLENPRYWVSVTEYVKALGGAVIDTAGSIIGGAFGIVKGVGKVVTGNCCEEEEEDKDKTERKKFLGIF